MVSDMVADVVLFVSGMWVVWHTDRRQAKRAATVAPVP